MRYSIIINNKGKVQKVDDIVIDTITLSHEMHDTASILQCTIPKMDGLDFVEGNEIGFSVDDNILFIGTIVAKSRDKEQDIKVTAYDNLFYLLKSIDTHIFEDATATTIIKFLCSVAGLQVGMIAETNFKIESLVCENTTFYDMIDEALKMTTNSTGIVYVLRSDKGKITLNTLDELALRNEIFDASTTENFIYDTSIAEDTYNQLKIYVENEETGQRDVAFLTDANNIARWGGVLQYSETLDSDVNSEQLNYIAKTLFDMYNKDTKTFSLVDRGGRYKLVGGNSVFVNFPNLSELNLIQGLFVASVTHNFTENEHFADITFKGDIKYG